MAQKYQELSDKIVGLVGGKANVQFFTHCVTRLRFNVKDESAVKKTKSKNCPVFSAPSGRTASTRSSSARLSTMPTA